MSTPPLFGLVPAGLPVLTTPTSTPTPTSFLYAIPPSPSSHKPFSHIVVFLLPGVSLPPATAAAIYLIPPPTASSPQQQPEPKFLGGIGPGKESAIFKLGSTGSGGNVVLGISVEAAESVAARMGGGGGAGALVPAQKVPPSTTLVLAQRIIKNAFNFLASFSGTTGAGGVEVVPLRAFEEWWKRFEARISSDPGFLERDE